MPKPLVCLESPVYYSLTEEGYHKIEYSKYYDSTKGVLNNIPTATTLRFSFFNAGRIPASTACIEIFIEPKEKLMEKPFPFKIFSVKTPLDGFYYDESEGEFARYPKGSHFGYAYWYNDNGNLDYPPLVVDDELHQLNLRFKLGTIYPQKEVNVTIEIFSTRQNSSANLWILISYCGKSMEEIHEKEWVIPIQS